MKWRYLDMTLKESTSSSNTKKIPKAVWSNFFMRIKSNKKPLIVMSILFLFGVPLTITASMINVIVDDYSMSGFAIIGVLCTAIALLCGFIIALNTFEYLYKKSKVDMIYSLPLNNRQRFLSDYLAGLFTYIVPYIVSIILSLIVHGLGYIAFSKWAEFTQDNQVTKYVVELSIYALLVMIMFYTITVMVTCCCGSMFEAIAYNIILNGLIPGVIATFLIIFYTDLYGVNIDYYLMDAISKSSPAGAVIGVLEYFINYDITTVLNLYVNTIIADVVYFVISYLLYSKRKAEDVSKPFAYKIFYYIVTIAIVFIIISSIIYSHDASTIWPMMFFSAIVYFVLEVITNRGFKKFGWSILRYVCTVCGVVVIALILKGTKGFGIENRVPSASSIKSVSVNYEGIYANNVYTSSYIGIDEDENITYTDRDVIDAVIAMHKDAVKNHFSSYIPKVSSNETNYDEVVKNWDYYSPEEAYYSDDEYERYYGYNSDSSDYEVTLNIVYTTYLGNKISRKYSVSYQQYMMLKNISTNKKYIQHQADEFKETLLDYTMQSVTYNDDYYYSSNYKKDPTKQRYQLTINSKLNCSEGKKYSNLTYSQIMELSEAYRKDLEKRTLDDIMTPTNTYCYIYNYIVLDSYYNTIQYLTQNGYLPPNLDTELQSYTLYNSYNDQLLKIYSPDDISCAGGDYYMTTSTYVATNCRYVYYSSETMDKILALFKVAQPNYVTTDRCYMIYFNGNMYVIPPKYSSIAEELYNLNQNRDEIYSFSYNKDYFSIIGTGYDFLDTYLAVHDIWRNYYNNNYSNYNTFVSDLMYGSVNMVTNMSDADTKLFKEYYNTFWTTYDDYNINLLFNSTDCYSHFYSYEDFVWYILKYSYNNSDDDTKKFFNDTKVTMPTTTEKSNNTTTKVETTTTTETEVTTIIPPQSQNANV